MRYFWDLRENKWERTLLIESGSRHLIDDLIPALQAQLGERRFDLVTCFAGAPKNLPEGSRIFRANECGTKEKRAAMIAEIASQGYSTMGMICSNEPVMTKWKWMIAWKTPAKLFILNENGDYFWFDRSNFATIQHFILFRMGLTGAGAIRTIARLMFFPFSVLYLLLYAFAAHSLRALRLKLQTKRI